MRKLTKFNIACIVGLWLFLCYLLIRSYGGVTFKVGFWIFLSALFVFLPIYKNRHPQK